MISATIAPTSSSPSASSPLALDATLDAVAVDGGTDFLMELQAAMTSPVALATEAKQATAPEIAAEMPATEMLDELQKLPSAAAPVDLGAAIFAVPPLLQPHVAEVVTAAPHAATPENSANTTLAGLANKMPEAALPNAVAETDSSVLTSLGRAEAQVVSPEASSTAPPATPATPPATTPVLSTVSKQSNGAQADQSVLQPLERVVSPTPLSEAAQSVAKLAAGQTPSTSAPLSEQRVVSTVAEPTASAPAPSPAPSDVFEGVGARTAPAAQVIEVVAKVDSGSMAETADLGAGSFEPLSASGSPPVSESADDLAGLRLNAPPVALASPANDAPDASVLPMMGLATAQAAPAFATSSVPVLDTTQRVPLEPHMMRLDSGPMQTEVIKLVKQGGGQIILELTHPDQGTYRLDLRMDAQGKALLVVEGASDSVRTRLEQGESGLREQLSQLGLSLELNYRQQNSSTASQDAEQNSLLADGQNTQGNTELGDRGQFAARTSLERGLVHLYA
jgi:hypothetical protein